MFGAILLLHSAQSQIANQVSEISSGMDCERADGAFALTNVSASPRAPTVSTDAQRAFTFRNAPGSRPYRWCRPTGYRG